MKRRHTRGREASFTHILALHKSPPLLLREVLDRAQLLIPHIVVSAPVSPSTCHKPTHLPVPIALRLPVHASHPSPCFLVLATNEDEVERDFVGDALVADDAGDEAFDEVGVGAGGHSVSSESR